MVWGPRVFASPATILLVIHGFLTPAYSACLLCDLVLCPPTLLSRSPTYYEGFQYTGQEKPDWDVYACHLGPRGHFLRAERWSILGHMFRWM